MDSQQADRYRRVIAKGESWETLWAFPEFQKWRGEAVCEHLDSLSRRALQSDMLTDAGRRDAEAAIIGYQELKRVTDDLFKVSGNAVEAARQGLRKG